MKVIQVREIKKVIIEYDNGEKSKDRNEVFKYLDTVYGKLNWKVLRAGPKELGSNVGLMVIEVDKNWRN